MNPVIERPMRMDPTSTITKKGIVRAKMPQDGTAVVADPPKADAAT
jgi:hypothetical protein